MVERGKATNANNSRARRSKLPSRHHAPSSSLPPHHDHYYPTMSTKRSASPSSPSSPSHKSQRIASSDARELVCSLPPTCSRNGGTRLQGTRELEVHYAKFHAHVCSAPRCECIFPEARLLELVRLFSLSQIRVVQCTDIYVVASNRMSRSLGGRAQGTRRENRMCHIIHVSL